VIKIKNNQIRRQKSNNKKVLRKINNQIRMRNKKINKVLKINQMMVLKKNKTKEKRRVHLLFKIR